MRIALAIIAGTLLLPAGATAFGEPQAGGKVLLVEIATQVIHDVLSDIILN